MAHPTRTFERQLNRQGYRLVAGADEAGRGAWAGPLVAAAVILPLHVRLPGVNDSKLLTPKSRERLFGLICRQAVAYQVVTVPGAQIDSVGLGVVNAEAVRQAASLLPVRPDYVVVDGFRICWDGIPSVGIVRGDSRVTCVAAASILAKVTRDRLMVRYHAQYPAYGFDRHKGYGTAYHRQQIDRYGLCPLHRRSFAPIRRLSSR
ncbi:MAG: ribonuclease HII [Patescibacteria group bacterium]